MELNKLRELVAFLREAGVSKYADEKITLELFEEVEYEEEVDEAPTRTVAQPVPMDPTEARLVSKLPPEYRKAFDIKLGERK